MLKPAQIPNSGGGGVSAIAARFRLIGHLMLDRRVNFFLKLLPVASLAYLINPVDLPTPLDDMGVLWLGMTLFVELSPPEVVAEHLAAIRGVVDTTAHDPNSTSDQVIDAEFRRIPPDEE